MDFTSANVEAAIVQFYSSGGSPETNQWLTQAQISPAAWNWAWELVSPEKKPEVQFFGANTISIKLSKYWHEVPTEQFEALRKKILDLLLSYRGAKIVQTRLCVAMASLLIHSIPKLWSDPVQDLVSLFQQHEQGRNLWLLLDLLTVIPEEFSTQAMQSQKRTQVRQELTQSLRHVMPLTLHVLEQKSSFPAAGDVAIQAVKCMQAWIQFGVPMEEMGPIFEILVAHVQDEELFDVALDALSSIVSHPDTHNYPNLSKDLLKRILSLQPILNQLMSEGSFDIATPLASLFVTFGETHSRLLIDWSLETPDGREAVLQLVSIILSISACSGQYPTQETISEMPFGFWYIFQDDIIACDPPQYDQCITTFSPVYLALVDSMLQKSMYRLNEHEWTADQRESFRCYRTDIADTIMYCYNILRETLLQKMLKHVDDASTLNLQDPNQHWPYLEAALYSWSAVAESLAEEEECPVLTQFLAKLPVLPYNNNMRVISAALDCIGGFAEWLAMHPDLLPHVTPIVTTALQNPELALYATMALKDMSRDCADGMKPYAEDILTSCHNALKSNQLKHSECIRLMYPIGKMLSQMAPEQILPRLEPILSPYLTELNALNSHECSQQTKAKTIFYLKLIASLFQALEVKPGNDLSKAGSLSQHQHPVAVIFPQMLPLLQQVAQRWVNDPEVIEDFCNLMKQCISTLSDAVKPFAQDIVMLLVNSYEVLPLSCTLELARMLFIMFGNESAPPMSNLIQSFLKHIVNKTLKFVGSTGNPSDFAELIASFFQVMSQLVKKVASLLVSTEDLGLLGLFQCACGCLGLAEADPVRYAANFLSHFINVSRDWPPLANIVNHHGEQLFMDVMRILGSSTTATRSSSSVDHFVDIIFAFNKKYFDNLRQWMNTLVMTDNFPSTHVTKEQKVVFAQMVLRERVNKRKLGEIVREFTLACCGMIDSSHALQMGQVMAAWDRVGLKAEEAAKNKNSANPTSLA